MSMMDNGGADSTGNWGVLKSLALMSPALQKMMQKGATGGGSPPSAMPMSPLMSAYKNGGAAGALDQMTGEPSTLGQMGQAYKQGGLMGMMGSGAGAGTGAGASGAAAGEAGAGAAGLGL